MYYKALGYVTHNVLRWYLGRRVAASLPARQQVMTVAGVGLLSVMTVGAAAMLVRSRRTVPTV